MGEANDDFIPVSGSMIYARGEADASRLPPICLPFASPVPPGCPAPAATRSKKPAGAAGWTGGWGQGRRLQAASGSGIGSSRR